MRSFCVIAVTMAIAGIPAAAAPQAPRPDVAYELIALDAAGGLLRFRSDRPGEARAIRVSGVEGAILGIDVRPEDGKLYGAGSDDALYAIDPETGRATRVSRLGSPFRGGTGTGFDFNPQADRLRLTTLAGQNLRVNVDVGAVAIDAPLRYAADDPHAGARPRIAAVAYTNSVPKARDTLTFDIDHALDVLALQDPPNDGVLNTVGELGVDCGEATGFDIAPAAAGRADAAFAVCAGILHSIDLDSGRAHALGAVGDGRASVAGLAVLPP